MALILNIETSTKVCSVTLANNGINIVVNEEIADSYIHSEKLTILIEKLFYESKFSIENLDAVCISKGPGSYTGLRIGVSVAKGICYALNIPLISIDSLTILGANFLEHNKLKPNSLLFPMIDARRMEVYTQKMKSDLSVVESIKALVVDNKSFSKYDNKIHIFGDGANKLENLFNNKNITVYKGFETSSSAMGQISYKKFLDKNFENTAYFEPYYLKDFVAIPSKKKLI